MRRALALTVFLLLGAPVAAFAGKPTPPRVSPFAASRYVVELPVMAGLWESGSGYVYVVAPGVRLAETRMVGRAPAAQVQTFYDGALASAGWRRAGGGFRRGRERLILHLAPHRAAGSMQIEALFVVTPDSLTTATPAAAHVPPRKHHR